MYPSIKFRPRNDGKFSTPKIYCFLRYNGELVRFSTNIESSARWNQKKQAFDGNGETITTLNTSIQKIRNRIIKIYDELVDNDKPVNSLILKDEYFRHLEKLTKKLPTILEVFDLLIKQKKSDGLEEKTLNDYELTKQRISDYIKIKHGKNDIICIYATDIFWNGFYEYLQTLTDKSGKKFSVNHCRRLMKRIFNAVELGRKKGYFNTNDVEKLDIKKEKQSGKVFSIEPDDVNKIYNVGGCNETETHIKDGFCFMCYTGLRYSDFIIFCKNPKLYIHNDDGFMYIELSSFKNRKDADQESSLIPIIPPALEILERYNYEIPTYKNQTYNRYIKDIAKRAGLKNYNEVVTYTGRKTCATVFGNMDGVEIKAVSKILGHKKVSTTETYYFRVKPETVKRQVKRVLTK